MPHVADPVLAGDDGSRCAGSIAIAHGVRHLTDGAHPAGGNVIGATDPPWVGDGQHVGGRDVGDMNEVPALRPVLEDARWSAPPRGAVWAAPQPTEGRSLGAYAPGRVRPVVVQLI